MNRKFILIAISLFALTSCKSRVKNDAPVISRTDSTLISLQEAKEKGIKVSGKFLQIKKVDDRLYELKLKVRKDTMTFTTYMSLDKALISLLKKDGDNIILNYTDYYNAVKKIRVRMVHYMEPVYSIKE